MADGPPLVEGVDYAWSRPDIAALAAAGKKFACRYGGPGSSGKQLDPAEAQALSAADVAIVANAEGAAAGLLGGFAAGVDWARQAEAHFRACGMPPDRPIYFSVDFDTTSGDWGALDAAMDGAASVIGRNRVGVYGEFSIVEHFAANGKARWFWQAFAWSSGRWSAHNHIEQYDNGVSLAGASLDLDRALTTDFGQWMATGDDGMTPMEEDEAWRVDGLWHHTDLRGGRYENDPEQNKNNLKAALDDMAAGVTTLVDRPPTPPAEVDIDALVAKLVPALRPVVAQESEAAVRRVMLDAATPDQAAQA